MLSSKLLKLTKPAQVTQPFPKSRFGFCNCSKIIQEDEETINEITSILSNNQDNNDFISRIKSFQNPLNPNLVQSILVKNQSCDPKKLLHFFNWSVNEKGIVPNLNSFLILAMSFASFNKLRYASNVLDQMVETRKPVSDVVEAVRDVGLSSLGFTQLVYAYKSKCMLDEAVFLLLNYGDSGCFVNSVCLNSLMSDLLKCNNMELFWKVYERLSEVNVKHDVYMYSNVIDGYCMSGKMEDAKRVFSEMEEDGCSPNLVTYNLLIGGLCNHGHVDEAIGYRRLMMILSNSEKMLLSKLLKLPNPAQITQPFPKSRFGFCNCSKIIQEDEETINEITSILNNNQDNNDFISRIKSFQNPLNPNLVQSILVKNQSCDPKKLLHFFNWSVHEKGILPTLNSFLILAMSFVSFNKLRYASNVLDQMVETRKPVSDVVEAVRDVGLSSLGFTQLVYAYKSKCMLDEAVFLLLNYGDSGCFVNSVCLNSLMSDLLKCNNMELFWKVYERLSEVNVKQDVYMYSNVIDGYCRSGKMEDAKRVFSEMEEDGCSPNLVTYNLLIGGLCQYGLVDEAIGYKKAMVEKGVVPDWYSYSVIIDELCKAKRSSDAILVQDDMKNAGLKPKTGPYSSLINRVMQKSKKLEALSSSDDMVDKLGTSQNLKSYLTLSKKFVDTGHTSDLKFARNILAMMAETRKPMSDVIDAMTRVELSSDMFTLVVYAYMNRRLFDEAVYLLLNYKNGDCFPDLVCLYLLMKDLLKYDKLDLFWKVYERLSETNVTLDLYFYNIVTQGYCKSGKMEDAKRVYSEMKEKDFRIFLATYNALIEGLLEQGKVDEALKLKDKMVATLVKVDIVTFICIIKGLCKLGEYKEAIKLLEGMKDNGVKPDVNCYYPIIRGLCKAKRIEEAWALFAQMRKNRVKPNAFTYGALMSAYNYLAKQKDVNEYFKEMIAHNIIPNQDVFASMFEGHFKRRNSKKALSIMRNIIGNNVIPGNRHIYNALIQSLLKNNMTELAMKLYAEVCERGLIPHVSTYTSLIFEFIDEGDNENALKLFNEMQQRYACPNDVTFDKMLKTEHILRPVLVKYWLGIIKKKKRGVTLVWNNGWVRLSWEWIKSWQLFNGLKLIRFLASFALCEFVRLIILYNIYTLLRINETMCKMMLLSRLIRPKPYQITQPFSQSRLGFCNHAKIIQQQQQDDDEETIKKITSILNNEVWKPPESYPNLYKKLNPNVVQSVIVQNHACSPQRLHNLFVWSSEQMRASQNINSYIILSKIFADSNELNFARKVLAMMAKSLMPVSDVVDAMTSVGVSTIMFTLVVNAFKKIHFLDKAVYVLLNYKNGDCFPDSVCLNLLMKDLLKYDKLDLFWRVYERLGEANVTLDFNLYNNVIDGYIKSGKMEDAKRVFFEMKEKDPSPSLVTYNLIIGGFLEQGEVDEALKLKNEMVTIGIKVDVVTFICIINGLCKLGEYKEAIKLLEGMKDDGVLPDVNSYYPIIHGLCKAKRIEEAWDLFAQMVENGVKPDVITYAALMSAYSNLSKEEDLITYFKELIAHGISPDQDVLAFMFESHFKKGYLYSKKPFSIMRKMLDNNVLPNNMHIYNAFIKGFSENDDMDLAMKLLAEVHERGLNPDAFTYRSLISGYLDEYDTEKARLLFNEMQQRNVCPNDVTYEEFLKTLPEKRKNLVRRYSCNW
ncbi:tetratricopeptide-like helical domain-containing protein [Artemisia annua]|uniref:Tetratricopeptide-like helical domain-containing protein n=1 Tax=Artemisia annua TaxID=35608 RepID=A0A2U1PXI0_ARTAN|nr:tetratricopeptide-like helical domain-containing protein [Artemisia annua]